MARACGARAADTHGGGPGEAPVHRGRRLSALRATAFYLPDHPDTHDMFIHSRLDMYSAHVNSLKSHLGEDAIYVDYWLINDRELRTLFEHVEWEPPLEIWRRPDYAVPVRTFHIARCRRYRLFVGLQWADGG